MKHLVPSIVARYYLLVSTLVLFSASVMFASPAFASPAFPKDNHTPVGQWHATVTFSTGPMAGQTQEVNFTFNAGGTMTSCVTSGSFAGVRGTGTWQQTNPDQFTFDLKEQTAQGTVHVTNQDKLTHGGNEFKGDGQGTLTAANGTILAQATETIIAERV